MRYLDNFAAFSAPAPTFLWMESQADFILFWLAAFFPIILLKIFLLKVKGIERARDSMLFTEAIGLPLTFMQPVAFVLAVMNSDWISAIVTFWWGPGFLFVVGLVIWSKLRRREINWTSWRTLISWLCKILYVVYVLLCLIWQLPKLAFALSVWIASDQVEKSFASLDADRTRRTFHDFWLIRILYPTLLFIPLLHPFSTFMTVFGIVLFLAWLAGLIFVYRKNRFMELPDDPTLLRNMMYFKDKTKPGSEA